MNRRFETAQLPKFNTYVLVVKKATQMRISKKIQPQKIGSYKIFDTLTLVTYKLENFLVNKSPVTEISLYHITRRNFSFKNNWRNISRITL